MARALAPAARALAPAARALAPAARALAPAFGGGWRPHALHLLYPLSCKSKIAEKKLKKLTGKEFRGILIYPEILPSRLSCGKGTDPDLRLRFGEGGKLGETSLRPKPF
jgi:hypothetical protein